MSKLVASIFILGLICACASAGLGQTSAPEDWPQWRGPRRDGTAPSAKLPAKWPEKAPAPVWSVRIGDGYSGPAVAGGRVFILARPAEGLESCLCFDAATGKRLWEVTYPCAFAPPDPRAGRGPNSTPTVDGDRVYMFGLHGMLHCLDVKSGKVLWKHDCAKEYWGVEKGPDGDDVWFPICGASASPLVLGDTVVVPIGGKKAGAFTAFDRRTGAVVWQELPERSSYASPMLAELAGKRQIVGFTGLRMVGLDKDSHKLLWEHPFSASFQQTIVSPVIWKDTVIIGGEAKPTLAASIRPEGDRLTPEIRWRNADLSAFMVTPVVMKDHLVGGDLRSRRLVCVDLATGATAWTSPRFGDYGSMVVAGEQVLALSNSGELWVFEANPKAFTSLAQWKISEEGGTWAHLAVAGSRLYVKGKERLACFDLNQG